MSYLFETNEKGGIIINQNCVKLVPEFRFLSSEEMLFVVLAVDYYSPYSQHPEGEVLRKAKFHAFKDWPNKEEPWDNVRIKAAMTEYLSLQYDGRRELLKVYKKKILMLQANLEVAVTAHDIGQTLKSINELQNNIRKLEEEIRNNNEYLNYIEGGTKLSLIEILQKNRQNFRDIQAPRTPWNPAKTQGDKI